MARHWYEWLAIAEFTYNGWIHTSTCSSPIMMDTRQNPRLKYRTTERVTPGDAQQLLLLDGSGHEGSHTQPYPEQQMTWAAFMMPIGGNPRCMQLEKRSGSMGKYHYYWPDEKARPQVAWSVPSGPRSSPECILTQTSVVIFMKLYWKRDSVSWKRAPVL